VTFHLIVEAHGAEFEAISHPVHLVDDFLGRTVRNLSTAHVTEDERGSSGHCTMVAVQARCPLWIVLLSGAAVGSLSIPVAPEEECENNVWTGFLYPLEED
jgi:hypothetical protein